MPEVAQSEYNNNGNNSTKNKSIEDVLFNCDEKDGLVKTDILEKTCDDLKALDEEQKLVNTKNEKVVVEERPNGRVRIKYFAKDREFNFDIGENGTVIIREFVSGLDTPSGSGWKKIGNISGIILFSKEKFYKSLNINLEKYIGNCNSLLETKVTEAYEIFDYNDKQNIKADVKWLSYERVRINYFSESGEFYFDISYDGTIIVRKYVDGIETPSGRGWKEIANLSGVDVEDSERFKNSVNSILLKYICEITPTFSNKLTKAYDLFEERNQRRIETMENPDAEEVVNRLLREESIIKFPNSDFDKGRQKKWKERYSLPIVFNEGLVFKYLPVDETTGEKRTSAHRLIDGWGRLVESGDIKTVYNICAEEMVPVELIFVALAESHWNGEAISRAGAKGYRQFMEETGKDWGLVGTLPDGKEFDYRDNVEKSTRAAVKYLKDLYRKFFLISKGIKFNPGTDSYTDKKCWTFAIWSFNRGFSNIRKDYKDLKGDENKMAESYNQKEKSARKKGKNLLALNLWEAGNYNNKIAAIRQALIANYNTPNMKIASD